MGKRKRILNRDIRQVPGSFFFCLVPTCNAQGRVAYNGFCGRHAKRKRPGKTKPRDSTPNPGTEQVNK